MIERAVIWAIAFTGLLLILSTCGGDECAGACALPIWAERS